MCILKVYTKPPFAPCLLRKALGFHILRKQKRNFKTINMNDIFDNKILCKKCNREMKKVTFEKNGFRLRAVSCSNCGEKIIHPSDLQEYKDFSSLRNKVFKVKMRIVGNSYAVSIPKEIVNFMKDQEKMMDDMVRLCFNDAKKLSLSFGVEEESEEDPREIARKKIKESEEENTEN